MHETGWLGKIFHEVFQTIAKTIRSFTAYSFLLLFLGALYGFFLDKIAALVGFDKYILLFIPLILAVLAYFITAVAIILFGFLILAVLLVFL